MDELAKLAFGVGLEPQIVQDNLDRRLTAQAHIRKTLHNLMVEGRRIATKPFNQVREVLGDRRGIRQTLAPHSDVNQAALVGRRWRVVLGPPDDAIEPGAVFKWAGHL